MSFLIDSRIKKYDLLTIQKSWHKVCVSTFYNSFNIDFYLLYEDIENVKICFYVNTRIHIDHWSVNYVFDDVCIIRIKIANKKWINVHNVYNASLNFYALRNSLTIIEIVRNHLNNDEKHIFWEISICIIRCEATRQNQFNMMQRINFWMLFNKFNFDSLYSQILLSEKRVIFKAR